MNPNERPSFMDRGTLIALAVVFLFWLGWTKFIESKYGAPTPVKASSPAAASAGAGAAPVATFSVAPGASATVSASNVVSVNATASGEPPKPEQVAHFEDDVWAFDLSSKGMSIRNVNLKKFKSREGDAVVLSESKNGEVSSFGTQLVDRSQDLEFTIEKSTEVGSSTGTGQSHWVGHATTSDGLQIEKSMLIDSSKYTIETSIHIAGVKPGFKGVSVRFGELFHDAVSGGLLNSSRYENQSFFVWHDENSTRLVLRKDKPTDIHESNVAVAGLSGHYFALGFVDRSALAPRFESVLPAQASVADARLIYSPVTAADVFDIKYTAFAGPKSFDLLSSIDENLAKLVDYGMFAVIARPILKLLKLIHEGVPNWGLAIILLTIVVRLIVLPFNIYSYRSMKVMQKLQPEMNRVRERYKDLPADQKLQMNQEIMDLMKKHKANPMGGCLPMLLQLPVFLALYQVLGQSIELYRAPFFLWITDLSSKDSYFVLPVLMGGAMFLNQKMTPTTMDPAQAKIMMWMPLIFSFFMISLPSGLTLYIFVSTLFGIGQQYYFVRDRNAVPAATVAKA